MNPRLVIIAATIVAGAGLAGVSLAAQAGTDPLDGSDIVSALASEATAADALPAALELDDLGQGGVLAETSRLLGTERTRQFWIARDAAGDICLVVELGDAGQTIASACNRPDRVQRAGLLLGFQGSGAESVAYLLPDDAILDRVGGPWTVVGDNVVVAPADELTESGSSVPRTDGDAIALVP